MIPKTIKCFALKKLLMSLIRQYLLSTCKKVFPSIGNTLIQIANYINKFNTFCSLL